MKTEASVPPALQPPGFHRWGQRHTLVLMCFLAQFISYTDRVNISVASVAMREQFGWTPVLQGYVLSSFFVGYLLFMIASGWLAHRFGGKRVLLVAVLAWSAFTLLTPWAASNSIAALIAVRILLGMGEAAVMPGVYELFGRWVPAGERTRSVARFLSGIPMGQVIGFAGAGWLVAQFGWPMAFYVFGAVGFLWALVWMPLVSDHPASDRRVAAAELALLPGRSHAQASGAHQPAPWKLLLSSSQVWAVIAAHFCSNWALYFFLSWLPSYFRDVQGLTIASAGLFSAAPWAAAFIVTNSAAVVVDRAIARGANVTRVRKVTFGLGLGACAVFLLAAQGAASATQALLLVCGATAAVGLTWAAFTPNLLEIAPRHAAVLMGFSNTLATIPGILGVAVTGWLVQSTGSYSAAFVLTASVCVAGALIFMRFGRAEPLVP